MLPELGRFDSIADFCRDMERQPERVAEDLAKKTGLKREIHIENWICSLTDLASLLRDPSAYIRTTADVLEELSELAAQYRNRPGIFRKALNEEGFHAVQEVDRCLEESSAALRKRAETLRRDLETKPEISFERVPVTVDLEVPFPEPGKRGRRKRADVVLTSVLPDGAKRVAVIEQKAWTEENLKGADGGLISVKDFRPIPHPADQVLGYIRLMENDGETLSAPGSLAQPFVYLHEQYYEGGMLFDGKRFPSVWTRTHFPHFVFSRGHCDVLARSLDRFLSGAKL